MKKQVSFAYEEVCALLSQRLCHRNISLESNGCLSHWDRHNIQTGSDRSFLSHIQLRKQLYLVRSLIC